MGVARHLHRKINEFLSDPSASPERLLEELEEARKAKTQLVKAGRKPLYPYELWADGQVHRLVPGKDFISKHQVVRQGLYRHAKLNQLRLRSNLNDDGSIDIQFLPDGSDQDFALPDLRGVHNQIANKCANRRELIERFVRHEINLIDACQQLGGISRQRLYQIVAALGLKVEKRPTGLSKLEPVDLDAYRRGEVTVKALADKAGISEVYLRLKLIEAGIRMQVTRAPNRKPAGGLVLDPSSIAEFLNGKSIAELAQEHECSTATISNALRRQGIHKNKRLRSDCFTLNQSERKALVERRISQRDLAKIRGVTMHTINMAMLRQGVEVMRPRDEL